MEGTILRAYFSPSSIAFLLGSVRGRGTLEQLYLGAIKAESLSFLTLAWRWQMRRSKGCEISYLKASLLPHRGPV